MGLSRRERCTIPRGSITATPGLKMLVHVPCFEPPAAESYVLLLRLQYQRRDVQCVIAVTGDSGATFLGCKVPSKPHVISDLINGQFLGVCYFWG